MFTRKIRSPQGWDCKIRIRSK